jgi:hypothetical protein
MKTVFLRALEVDDKAAALVAMIHGPKEGSAQNRFELNAQEFRVVSRSPFAYWASTKVRQLFTALGPFEGEGRIVKQGLATADDFRFVRAWWEVPPAHLNTRWFPFAKGGKFSRFYAELPLAVKWQHHGEEISSNLNDRSEIRSNIWMLRETATNYFLRPAVTWPRRTNGFSVRVLPSGCVFADKGPAAFVETDDEEKLLNILAITNSSPFRLLVSLQLARTELAQSYEVGLIQSTPFPQTSSNDQKALAQSAARAWLLMHDLDSNTENSRAFYLPSVLQVEGDTLSARSEAVHKHVRSVQRELDSILAEVDEICSRLYGIDSGDCKASNGIASRSETSASTESDGDDEIEECETKISPESLGAELVAWVFGVAFGRFDIRLASPSCRITQGVKPFAALPVSSVGMLATPDALPVATPTTDYPIQFPNSGVLANDRGNISDINSALRNVFNEVFKSKSDIWWSEIATVLDPKGNNLGQWLESVFFDYHLKRYSKSRRKAPIYWQLSIPSSRYSVWLYAHRLTRDTFFQLQSHVVNPKVEHEERQLANLVQKAGPNPPADVRKKIAAQEMFVEELRTMLAEIKNVAPLWNPNLDDGIVLTMAPLWRLVPHHKAWQKELKSKWDELAIGNYDWAHIAMHLWPERVVPKCATDRSLAIAHGLEDVFWQKDQDDKWQPRHTPTRPVEELVHERKSPAVKAALKSLLETGENGAAVRRRAPTPKGAPA